MLTTDVIIKKVFYSTWYKNLIQTIENHGIRNMKLAENIHKIFWLIHKLNIFSVVD